MLNKINNIFIFSAIGLILLRIVLVILVTNNIPFTDMQLGGFRPHFNDSYRPDEQQYFNLAQGFSLGEIRTLEVNIGYSVFLTPIIYFTQAKAPIEIAKIVFIIQEFLMFPTALILMMFMARRLFSSVKMAVTSGLLFVIYPWLLLTAGKLVGYDNAIPAFHHQLWIIVQSDYLSAIFVYFAFFLFFKWLDELFEKRNLSATKIILLAIVVGAALFVRMNNIWAFLIIFATILYAAPLKKALVYGLAALFAYSPHILLNWYLFGAPWLSGYQATNIDNSPFTWFGISNLWLNFSRFSPEYYFPWFLGLTLIISIAFVFGFIHIFKINRRVAIICAFWLWTYLVFFGLFKDALQSLRYFLPIVPVLIYFCIASVVFLYEGLSAKLRQNSV